MPGRRWRRPRRGKEGTPRSYEGKGKGALFGDAIINRYDQLNRNGIRRLACAGSITSSTDVQGAEESFNARIGVSIIAIFPFRSFVGNGQYLAKILLNLYDIFPFPFFF